jgi:hypothetical protein
LLAHEPEKAMSITSGNLVQQIATWASSSPAAWTCPVCNAGAVIDNGRIVAVAGTFSKCVSLECCVAAQSNDPELCHRAFTDCPEFPKAVGRQQFGQRVSALLKTIVDQFLVFGFSGLIANQVKQALERVGVPPIVNEAIANTIGIWANIPVLWVSLVSGIYAFVVAVGYFIGREFVIMVPFVVRHLKDFVDGSLFHGTVLAVALLIASIAWVAASRRHPRFFGACELNIGFGVTISSFLDAANAYVAFFALLGGTFTIIDGLQRIVDATVVKKAR